MHLSKDVLKTHIQNGLVTGYADLDGQLTANGFDVRVCAIVEIIDGGKLAVAKPNNKPPKLGKAYILKGYEDRLAGYDVTEKMIVDSLSIKLEKLRPYFAITCEKVNTPPNLMFHIVARTSLFRLTQSALISTVGEAGYQGFLTFMLLPFLDSEIELGARFAQFCFTELKGSAHYAQQKESNYQGGKIF